MVHFVYASSRSRAARVGCPRGARPRGYGGPQAPSYKETNIPFPEQGKPLCIPPIILTFYFESLLTMKLDCALSL
jgi:hypothetical protein